MHALCSKVSKLSRPFTTLILITSLLASDFLLTIAGSFLDERLNRVVANTDKMVAALPALLVASDPFQSVSSVSNAEGKMTAYDFKARLLLYYFNQPCPRLPPGLAQGQPLPSFRMQCMISKLWLDREIVVAAHIVPNSSNSARVSFALTWKFKLRDM